MAEGPIAWATLIFVAMAGIGSLIRVFQNRRLYKFHKRVHELNKKHQSNAPDA